MLLKNLVQMFYVFKVKVVLFFTVHWAILSVCIFFYETSVPFTFCCLNVGVAFMINKFIMYYKS